jgi:hypothetical protein
MKNLFRFLHQVVAGLISGLIKYADPTFDQIAATTLADLRDDVLYDVFFVDTAWQRKMRTMGALDEFLGGTVMQTPFQYDRVNGGATDIAVDFYRHGQNITGSNRSIFINGITEALNDGVNPSWDGNVFTTYGGQARNAAIGNVLNSVPIWVGDQAGNTGQISYKVLVEAYLNCVQRPDIGLCNKALYAYLLERQEPKQRFETQQDVSIGMSGLRLLDAMIFEDKLAPSTKNVTHIARRRVTTRSYSELDSKEPPC